MSRVRQGADILGRMIPTALQRYLPAGIRAGLEEPLRPVRDGGGVYEFAFPRPSGADAYSVDMFLSFVKTLIKNASFRAAVPAHAYRYQGPAADLKGTVVVSFYAPTVHGVALAVMRPGAALSAEAVAAVLCAKDFNSLKTAKRLRRALYCLEAILQSPAPEKVQLLLGRDLGGSWDRAADGLRARVPAMFVHRQLRTYLRTGQTGMLPVAARGDHGGFWHAESSASTPPFVLAAHRRVHQAALGWTRSAELAGEARIEVLSHVGYPEVLLLLEFEATALLANLYAYLPPLTSAARSAVEADVRHMVDYRRIGVTAPAPLDTEGSWARLSSRHSVTQLKRACLRCGWSLDDSTGVRAAGAATADRSRHALELSLSD